MVRSIQGTECADGVIGGGGGGGGRRRSRRRRSRQGGGGGKTFDGQSGGRSPERKESRKAALVGRWRREAGQRGHRRRALVSVVGRLQALAQLVANRFARE